ncbi:MAG: hypothetical protein WD535_05380 [Thermaerobacterales bacterium]
MASTETEPAVIPVQEKVLSHLKEADPVIKELVEGFGPYRIPLEPNLFTALVDAILGQQISIHAAAAVRRRLYGLYGGRPPEPGELAATRPDILRGAGLSGAKIRYVLGLAETFAQQPLSREDLAGLDDREVTDRLIAFKGVGPWTVQMLLIFSLGRLNVLPVLDIGLQAAAQHAYGLTERPVGRRLAELAEPWHPYCTIATWYLWRSRDDNPNLK